ncbi:MAG: hypothetical protein J3Q66DRAFT_434721 [Benniella sp.]|nr:MAG: hypothetical protein J3Q66DRAFT_434721 [Benniella sp.]
MENQPLETWNWTEIDVIDFHLDIKDKEEGIATLSNYPYPFMSASLMVANAHKVKSLKTSSINTISELGDTLRNLTALEYTVDLGDVNGVSYQWIVKHTDQIEELPSTMVTPLKTWAYNMLAFGSSATGILARVLDRNQDLESVNLQLQANHCYGALMLKLAALKNLKALTIGGSDLESVEVCLLHPTTDIVLDILKRCGSLNSLVFRPFPVKRSVLRYHAPTFTSPITILDLSGIRNYHVGGMNAHTYYPFHLQWIVPRCPNLRMLLMPRYLPKEDIKALARVLAASCPHLRNIHFYDTNLDVPPFMRFMESMTTLRALFLTDCKFSANDFRTWLGNQRVQMRLQSVIVEYERIAQSPECQNLMLMMPASGTLNRTKTKWLRGPTFLR